MQSIHIYANNVHPLVIYVANQSMICAHYSSLSSSVRRILELVSCQKVLTFLPTLAQTKHCILPWSSCKRTYSCSELAGADSVPVGTVRGSRMPWWSSSQPGPLSIVIREVLLSMLRLAGDICWCFWRTYHLLVEGSSQFNLWCPILPCSWHHIWSWMCTALLPCHMPHIWSYWPELELTLHRVLSFRDTLWQYSVIYIDVNTCLNGHKLITHQIVNQRASAFSSFCNGLGGAGRCHHRLGLHHHTTVRIQRIKQHLVLWCAFHTFNCL